MVPTIPVIGLVGAACLALLALSTERSDVKNKQSHSASPNTQNKLPAVASRAFRLLGINPHKRTQSRKDVEAVLQRRPDIDSVFVSREFASQFRSPPKDGRPWYIVDPDTPSVLHCISKDGVYSRSQSPGKDGLIPPFGIPFTVSQKGKPSKKRSCRSSAGLGESDIASLLANPEQARELPAILIPLSTVIRMTGFKKSFIYAQEDFPAPIKFGSSRRAAVRWCLREVVEWIDLRMQQRLVSCAEEGGH